MEADTGSQGCANAQSCSAPRSTQIGRPTASRSNYGSRHDPTTATASHPDRESLTQKTARRMLLVCVSGSRLGSRAGRAAAGLTASVMPNLRYAVRDTVTPSSEFN